MLLGHGRDRWRRLARSRKLALEPIDTGILGLQCRLQVGIDGCRALGREAIVGKLSLIARLLQLKRLESTLRPWIGERTPCLLAIHEWLRVLKALEACLLCLKSLKLWLLTISGWLRVDTVTELIEILVLLSKASRLRVLLLLAELLLAELRLLLL